MGIRGNRKKRPRYCAALLIGMSSMDAYIDAGLIIGGNYAETVHICASVRKAAALLKQLLSRSSLQLPQIVLLDARLLETMQDRLFGSLQPYQKQCGFRYVVVGKAPECLQEPDPPYAIVERPLTESALQKLL